MVLAKVIAAIPDVNITKELLHKFSFKPNCQFQIIPITKEAKPKTNRRITFCSCDSLEINKVPTSIPEMVVTNEGKVLKIPSGSQFPCHIFPGMNS